MNDGKIYIVITNKYQGGDGTPNDEMSENKSESQSSIGKYATHRFFNFMEQQATKVVNYSINNIGNFTGDYQAQRDVQASIGLLNRLMNLGNAAVQGALAGAKAGGGYGAAIGAAIGLIVGVGSEAVSVALESNSFYIQQKKANREINILKERSGLNSLMDGSRGTEN